MKMSISTKIDIDINEKLREFHKKSNIPLCYIIEKALKEFLLKLNKGE